MLAAPRAQRREEEESSSSSPTVSCSHLRRMARALFGEHLRFLAQRVMGQQRASQKPAGASARPVRARAVAQPRAAATPADADADDAAASDALSEDVSDEEDCEAGAPVSEAFWAAAAARFAAERRAALTGAHTDWETALGDEEGAVIGRAPKSSGKRAANAAVNKDKAPVRQPKRSK